MVSVRWMIRRDLDEVYAIDEQENQWDATSEVELLSWLRQRNCIGMVSEQTIQSYDLINQNYKLEDIVIGWMIYELQKDHLHILKMCGNCKEEMICKLVSKLSTHRRTHLRWEVDEKDLQMQIFLRSQGFKAIETKQDQIIFESFESV